MPAGSIWHSLRQLVSMSSHTIMSTPLSLTHGCSNTPFFPHQSPAIPWCLYLYIICFSELQRSDTHSGLAVGERKAAWGGNHELSISQTVFASAIPSKKKRAIRAWPCAPMFMYKIQCFSLSLSVFPLLLSVTITRNLNQFLNLTIP